MSDVHYGEWQYIQFLYPGYNYLGPGNRDMDLQPINSLDAAARVHDLHYGRYLAEGKTAAQVYGQFNQADRDFLETIRNLTDLRGDEIHALVIATSIFKLKRYLASVMSEPEEVAAELRAMGVVQVGKRYRSILPVKSLTKGYYYFSEPPFAINLGRAKANLRRVTPAPPADVNSDFETPEQSPARHIRRTRYDAPDPKRRKRSKRKIGDVADVEGQGPANKVGTPFNVESILGWYDQFNFFHPYDADDYRVKERYE